MNRQSFYRLTLNLLLLVLAQGAAVAQVSQVEIEGVIYKNVDGEWVASGIYPENVTNGHITVLSQISVSPFPGEEPVPYNVKKIASEAFEGSTDFSEVTISEGITIIGSEAFYGCSGLTHLELPSTITTLETNAIGRGANLRWVDCREVTAMSDATWLGNKSHSPYELGVDKHTLLYMPTGCDKDDYPYPNVVFTDEGGSLTCLHFDFPRNMDYCVPWGFTADEVSAYPELKQDEYAYSLCLPFNWPAPHDAKFYELRSRDGDDVYFGLVSGTVNAFTPYLIVAADNDVTIQYQGSVEILSTSDAENQLQTATAAGVTIHGTLRRINNAEAAGQYYVLQTNNEWRRVPSNSSVGVPPFRAYLTLDGSQPANLHFGLEDGTEGISLAGTATDGPSCDAWYTLQGQRLTASPSAPGIYIHHDRKIMVR